MYNLNLLLNDLRFMIIRRDILHDSVTNILLVCRLKVGAHFNKLSSELRYTALQRKLDCGVVQLCQSLTTILYYTLDESSQIRYGI